MPKSNVSSENSYRLELKDEKEQTEESTTRSGKRFGIISSVSDIFSTNRRSDKVSQNSTEKKKKEIMPNTSNGSEETSREGDSPDAMKQKIETLERNIELLMLRGQQPAATPPAPTGQPGGWLAEAYTAERFHPSMITHPIAKLTSGMSKEQVKNFLDEIERLVPVSAQNRDEILIIIAEYHSDPNDVTLKRTMEMSKRVSKSDWKEFRKNILTYVAQAREEIGLGLDKFVSLLTSNGSSLGELLAIADAAIEERYKRMRVITEMIGEPATMDDLNLIFDLMIMTHVMPPQLTNQIIKSSPRNRDDVTCNTSQICREWIRKNKDESQIVTKRYTVVSVRSKSESRDRSRPHSETM